MSVSRINIYFMEEWGKINGKKKNSCLTKNQKKYGIQKSLDNVKKHGWREWKEMKEGKLVGI